MKSNIATHNTMSPIAPDQEEGDSSYCPYISLVIPVRNEERYLAATLDMVLEQDYPAERWEVLVVDGESTDGTRTIVERYADHNPHVRYLPNPNIWSSSARNVGVRAARGDIVVIIDGHCQIPDNQHLRSLARSFHDPSVDCVGRPQPQDIRRASRLQQAIAAARSSRLGHHPDSYIYADRAQIVPAHSVAIAYRRKVFDQVGYFDERFDACEDVEFNHRVDKASMRCLFEPAVSVVYHPRTSLHGLYRQLQRYGRGRVRLGRKHPETIGLKSFLPALWLVYMALLPASGWFAEPLRTMYWIGVGTYFLAVVVSSLRIAVCRQSVSLLGLLPLVFVTIHLGAATGLLREILFPFHSPRKP